ncbi:hydrolase (plasmid) [Hymenobacter sp. NBH84]|uniref:Hydrolase n=1 Tax=Hymenobacter citatus TaxID=2763506 RepID=A0ABR7MQ58_9BACT|nr:MULTISPECIES: CPCC family cysteine-rich protein [Hymenobacter]MBC6613219.1 hydrolase [Hymenobacter citatus]QNE41928.1 hydrolase [Hymenobacter sp. NBH84]
MSLAPNQFGRYPCPCCHYHTFQEPATGEYIICPVCFWEDDPVQAVEPTFVSGANQVSLRQAQVNFVALGVSDPTFKRQVRLPTTEELPDQ